MSRYSRIPAIIILSLAVFFGALLVNVSRGGRVTDKSLWSLEQLEVAIAAGDNDAQTWRYRGDRLLDRKLPSAAAEAYGRALEIEPTLREARIGKGSSLARGGDEAAFLAYLRELVLYDPKLAEDLLDRPECRPWLDKPAFELLKKDAHISAMD